MIIKEELNELAGKVYKVCRSTQCTQCMFHSEIGNHRCLGRISGILNHTVTGEHKLRKPMTREELDAAILEYCKSINGQCDWCTFFNHGDVIVKGTPLKRHTCMGNVP